MLCAVNNTGCPTTPAMLHGEKGSYKLDYNFKQKKPTSNSKLSKTCKHTSRPYDF